MHRDMKNLQLTSFIEVGSRPSAAMFSPCSRRRGPAASQSAGLRHDGKNGERRGFLSLRLHFSPQAGCSIQQGCWKNLPVIFLGCLLRGVGMRRGRRSRHHSPVHWLRTLSHGKVGPPAMRPTSRWNSDRRTVRSELLEFWGKFET